jgi:hypothetical protein
MAMLGTLDENTHKQHILRDLSRRFFLRFHTFILIAWTFCVGLLTTKYLWWLDVDSMWLRYTLATLAAYGAFLVGVRVWLAYVDLGRHVRRRDPDDAPQIDFPYSGDASKGYGHCEAPRVGGGHYGGGGSSGQYGSGEVSLPEAIGAAGDGCLPVLALGAVLAILAGAFSLSTYIVAEAPMVLVEAAFEAMLAGGLLRTRRWASEADWLGAVLRYTWKTLAFVLGVTLAFSLAVAHFLPEARTLAQVVAALLGA